MSGPVASRMWRTAPSSTKPSPGRLSTRMTRKRSSSRIPPRQQPYPWPRQLNTSLRISTSWLATPSPENGGSKPTRRPHHSPRDVIAAARAKSHAGVMPVACFLRAQGRPSTVAPARARGGDGSATLCPPPVATQSKARRLSGWLRGATMRGRARCARALAPAARRFGDDGTDAQVCRLAG
jgi:hypothetical protein